MDAIKLLGALMSNKSLASGLGQQLLGGLLGGGAAAPQPQRAVAGGGGALGSILGAVMGGGGGGGGGGNPLGSIFGSVLGGGGGGGQAGGGMGALLGGLMGGGAASRATAAPQPQADTNAQAAVMIRAMVNAAKSDGQIDQTEQQNIISKLGNDVSQAEVDFLKREFAAPLDVAGFARSVPRGLEQQVYVLSLTSIDLDTQNEANYLGQLAQAMNLDPAVCNQIHDKVGAPRIFA